MKAYLLGVSVEGRVMLSLAYFSDLYGYHYSYPSLMVIMAILDS
jgi:hypothetical protein